MDDASSPADTQVTVVRLGSEDWQAYREVRLSALRQAPGAFGSTAAAEEEFTEAGWRARLSGAGAGTVLASIGGEPAGLAGYWSPEPGTAELVSMWTAPAARGRGVGARLVEAVLDEAAEDGLTAVRLWVVAGNDAAERLYARCGFVPDGVEQALPSDPSAVERRMSRELPGATLEGLLAQRVAHAARAAFGVELAEEQAVIRPAGRPGADYQSNAAMGLAGRLGLPSRQVGEELAARLRPGRALAEAVVTGPGFVNLRFRRGFLAARLRAQAADARLGVPLARRPERIVVDYSAPNAAKEMQAHHLRSTVIGDALVRLLEFLGHEVLRQNHIGDWGTPFGMLIEHSLDRGGDAATIDDLTAFYREARARFDGEPGFADRSRARLAALQSGDPEALRLWRVFVDESLRHMAEVYELLGVRLEPSDVRGESFYNPMLGPLVERLREAGAVVESDGALCAFPAGFTGRDGAPVPLMVAKSDGAYTYDTTDLAAVEHRVGTLKADRALYLVDAAQRQHFAMVFATAREAGLLPAEADFRHVSFGSVLGEDGRRLKTRAGSGSLRLIDLLREGVERAGALIAEREGGGADRAALPAAERARVARAVGVGAAKYADLACDRERDSVFSLDRMLAMDGNTAVYLQYANARMRSVLRRAGEAGAVAGEPDEAALREPAERALAMALLRTPRAVLETAESLRPHRLCRHLYEVAVAFSAFYEACPVLRAGDPAVRRARLALCAQASRTVVVGLGLLGIETPDRL